MGAWQPRNDVHGSELLVKWVLLKTSGIKAGVQVVLIKMENFIRNEVKQYGEAGLYYRGRTGKVPSSD